MLILCEFGTLFLIVGKPATTTKHVYKQPTKEKGEGEVEGEAREDGEEEEEDVEGIAPAVEEVASRHQPSIACRTWKEVVNRQHERQEAVEEDGRAEDHGVGEWGLSFQG